jgi:membrane protein DedA with SNARE-associated domain
MATASDGSWLTALVDWAVSLMQLIGPAGAGLAIGLENLFPPLPSEVILPMAGLSASRGIFTLAEALVWTTAGSVAGAFLLYGLGRWLGAPRLRAVAARVPMIRVDDIDKTIGWFERHGGKAVFFGRMIPLFRSLISIPAGVTRMPVWKFGLLTVAGSLVWNTVFVLAGYFLGESWHVVEMYADLLQYIVIAVVGIAVAWFVVARTRTLLRDRALRRGMPRRRATDAARRRHP